MSKLAAEARDLAHRLEARPRQKDLVYICLALGVLILGLAWLI